MAKGTRAEKIKFAKEQVKKGVTAPGKLQKIVKEKFGSGLNFSDLGVVYPKKLGAKKKAAGKKTGKKRGRPKGSKNKARKPGRPPKKGGRRGRKPGSSSDQWLLLAGDQAEMYGGMRQLQNRAAELLSEGYTQNDIAIYEKTSMTLTVKTDITL